MPAIIAPNLSPVAVIQRYIWLPLISWSPAPCLSLPQRSFHSSSDLHISVENLLSQPFRSLTTSPPGILFSHHLLSSHNLHDPSTSHCQLIAWFPFSLKLGTIRKELLHSPSTDLLVYPTNCIFT